MRLSELWRTSTARLTLLYGLVFALGVPALLGMVYVQSSIYLTRRIDGILQSGADALAHTPRAELPQRVEDAQAINGPVAAYGLFSAEGRWLAGNLHSPPRGLLIDAAPKELSLAGSGANLRL